MQAPEAVTVRPSSTVPAFGLTTRLPMVGLSAAWAATEPSMVMEPAASRVAALTAMVRVIRMLTVEFAFQASVERF
ncbi:hypothetical protein GCM10020229_52510 [Kitasatospora albolonga]